MDNARNVRWIRRRGSSLVELALAMTFLLIFVGAVVDLGRFAYYYVAVSDSVSAAARFASYHPSTSSTRARWVSETRQMVVSGMQGVLGYEANRLTVSDPVLTTDPPPFAYQRVRVQAQYDFRTLVSWPGLPTQLVIARSLEMRMVR
jgi:Flp pilus assembly protein TadG